MSQDEFAQRFPEMKPVKSPPPLFRLNGFGTGMYGSRAHDPQTQTYISTLCVSLLFIPVLALRSYRVAKAQRGWYFIGREPLSVLAKGWNALLLAAILTGIGIGQYDEYTSSPGYRAKQQMATARHLADSGKLHDAATIYQNLALAGGDQADNAALAIKDLLDNRVQQADLNQCAGVFSAAVLVSRRRPVLSHGDLADKGMKLVAARGDSDPRSAIAILDAIRPLQMDTRPIDERKLPLLRKWTAKEPNNLDAVVPLASILEQQNQSAEAKKLLLPFKDKLANGEGARVLGTILGREGNYDEAYALLWPYVKSRLDTLHAAENNAEGALKRLWDRETDLLNDHKGPADFYSRYNAATKENQPAIVREYVNNRIKNDPQFTETQDALAHESEVVPVALELGIIMLQRAQGQSDPAARKSQLESAEQVFLAISGVAGETDEYRLTLGQVYYWLGRQQEGRKLFDDFLAAKKRAYKDLLAIASKLHDLGAIADARAMSEEAYGKATESEERYGAAQFRAVCFKDLDDRITWLSRAGKDAKVKADLAKAQGDKAFEEGRDDEAGRDYHIAIDAYGAMPRSATSVNDQAIAYASLYQATGDREAFDRCCDRFQQAVDLQPSDPILLSNAGTTLLGGALADVMRNEIDLRALHDTGSFHLLGYLHHDEATRNALAQRVKNHPGVIRAMGYLDKVMVLSPKQADAFSIASTVYHFTRDEAALRALEKRVLAADLDTSDQIAERKQFINGDKDQQHQVALGAAMKRADALIATLRPRGGVTAAVADAEQASYILRLDQYTGTADLERAITLAEETQKLAPSASSSGLAIACHCARAARQLRGTDAEFDAFYKKYSRSVPLTYLMTWAATHPSSFQKAALQGPDMQKVIAIVREEARLSPDSRSAYEWALLQSVDVAEAQAAADAIRKNPRYLIGQTIDSRLSPADAGEAMETYWLMQIHNKPDEARQALRRIADLGIPIPDPG